MDIQKSIVAILDKKKKIIAHGSRRPLSLGRHWSSCHYHPPANGFLHNEENPLEVDFLIVDEASMLGPGTAEISEGGILCSEDKKMKKLLRYICLLFIVVSLACNSVTSLVPSGKSTDINPQAPNVQDDGLSAEATAAGSVLLKWEPIGGAEKYLLEVQIGNEFVALARVPASQVSYEDTNVPPASRFTYRLSSLAGTERGQSKEITIETPSDVSNPLKVSIEFDKAPAVIDPSTIDPKSIDPNAFDPNNFDPSMFLPQPVQTEAVIGPQGGEISVTGSNGIIYTLSVPPYALSFETTITLRPISAMPDLPLSGGLMAAVFIEPESLVFDVPATLTMTPPADFPAAAGPLVMAFAFGADGQEFHLYPFAAAGGQSSIGAHLARLQVVPNFDGSPKIKPVSNGGGYGKGSGTAKDAKEIGRKPSSKSQNRTEQRLAADQLDDLTPLQPEAALKFGKEGESILQKASQADDLGKFMQALDDFSIYLQVGGDKYEHNKELNKKILDLLVDQAGKLLDKNKGGCLKQDDFRAQALIERLTNPKSDFSKTFAERFKQKHGQQALDDLAKTRITCSVELTLNSTETFEAAGSTLHAAAKVSEMKLFPTYSKGDVYWSGEGDMKQTFLVTGICTFPLKHYDSLKFAVSKLIPIFGKDGELADFNLSEYAVKGWDHSTNVSVTKSGDTCPTMVQLKGGGDYWTGLFIGARLTLGNQSITGWDVQTNTNPGDNRFHSLDANWESVNPEFVVFGVADSKSSEDTKFKLKVTKNAK